MSWRAMQSHSATSSCRVSVNHSNQLYSIFTHCVRAMAGCRGFDITPCLSTKKNGHRTPLPATPLQDRADRNARNEACARHGLR